MSLVLRVLGILLSGALGFVGGGFVARLFLVAETTGFEGAATVFWSALAGTVLGLLVGYLALRG